MALPAPGTSGMVGVESEPRLNAGEEPGPGYPGAGAERGANDDDDIINTTTRDGAEPADDISRAPPPATRRQMQDIMTAVCVIWACFQADDAVRPNLHRPIRGSTHTAPHAAGMCVILMTTPDAGYAAHPCGRPPPDHSAIYATAS